MNIGSNWWTACIEDGIFIYKEDAVTLRGKYNNGAGDYISNRNAAGIIAVMSNEDKVRFLNTDFVEFAQDIIVPSTVNRYGVVSCSSNFYTIVDNNGDFTIRRYNSSGVYTTDTWTITGNYERNHGAVLNDQTFYWANGDTILAWDLNTDSALPNLVTLTDYDCRYILATVDGRIAICWENVDPTLLNYLKIYTTAGATFASYEFFTTQFVALSNTLNWDNNQLWCARYDQGYLGFLLRMEYSTGVINVEEIISTPAQFTYPPHAEFGFYPLIAGSGERGGLYKLIKDLKHDETWVSEDSYIEVKKPDPFVITALFGDEP